MQSDRHPAVPDSEPVAGVVSASAAGVLPRDFTGKWQVRRTVIDHFNRQRHDFTGLTTITGTSIVERGELQIGDAAIEASRTYQLTMDDGGVIVRFATGLEFVRLDLAACQTVHHCCGADMYRGRFLFQNRNCWSEFWRVRGPRKRYVSLTRYRRLG
ncbi:hypothetical protein ASD64_07960 [Mesorhizobium sp. Root157]|nr:hypothetical protein ASD64_07960 [Mesorhizobium sp. Root157]